MITSNLASIYTGGKDSLSQRKLAKIKNDICFTNTFSRLVLDGLQRYDIKGLPETCNKRVVKESFLWHGSCVFFEKSGNLIALPGAQTEDFNIYGDAKYAFVWGRQGFNEKISLYIPGGDISDFVRKTLYKVAGKGYQGVFVRENYICFPFINHCIDYASAISDTMRTLDVVRANIKNPFIMVAEQSVINSVKRFFQQRNENLEYIVDSGVFPVDKVKLLPIDTNATALKDATDLIEWYYNMFYELCGINTNANPDKKAELTSFEINANNDIVKVQADKTMECLQEHFDIVNKVYGTNIQVVAQSEELSATEAQGNSDNSEEEDTEDEAV